MFVEKIRNIFNFPVDVDEVVDELIFLYESEINDKQNEEVDEHNELKNTKNFLYKTVSDLELIGNWQSVDSLNIDRLLAKIDKQIARLEGKQLSEEKSNDNFENNKKKRNNDYNTLNSQSTDVFIKCRPNEGFSDYYKLFYVIVFLYKIAIQIKNNEYNENSVSNVIKQMVGYRIPLKNGENIINQLANLMRKQNNDNIDNFDDQVELESWANNYLNDTCKRLLVKKQIEKKDENLLLLAIQFHVFIQMISDRELKKQNALQNSVSIVALLCANNCRNKNDYEFGIKFATISLYISDPSKRQDAYNVLGLCAIDSEQYQFAYDIYFSWINRQMVDDMFITSVAKKVNQSQLDFLIQSKVEDDWRKENSKKVALMYGNFAYVCGSMYDSIEDSFRKRRLMFLAKHYIMKAIEFDPSSSSYCCSAGTIFIDGKDQLNALKYYKKYKDLARTPINKILAIRAIISVYKEMMLNSRMDKDMFEDFDDLTNQFVELYRTCMNSSNKQIHNELLNSKNLYFLLSECQRLSANLKEIKYLIFQISAEVNSILGKLRQVYLPECKYDLHIEKFPENIQNLLKEINSKTYRTPKRKHINNAKEIAYYTSLSNLQFLFSEIPDAEETGASLNCLTMMHARYMNDPEEGLTLLQNLKEFLPKTPQSLRNELYDQKFVFLKSFTGLIDQLNMWTMYGSDKSDGNDCNGCCVCIAPETFDMMVKHIKKVKNNKAVPLNFHLHDDFHLYSVAYIDGKDVFVNGQKDIKLRRDYILLRKTLEKLDQVVKKSAGQDKEIVSNCLVRLFEKLMFLFKDISYSLEGESRLIITRDINDRDEIHRTEQIPPKLYINPPYQIFPEKIILGPKVETPDYWIPHLQYELSKISEKWEETREFRPLVRISKISIR